MSRTQKKSVGRFLKRNTLNILIILAVVLLLAALFSAAVLVVDLLRTQEPAAPVQQPSAPEEPSSPDAQPGAPTAQQPPADTDGPRPDALTPPFDGSRQELLADGRLLVYYDPEALKLTTDGEGLYSLVGLDGATTPRVDLQALPAALSELENDELERLAIGIVQAYYYLAPETGDFTVSSAERTADGYSAELLAPAYDGAPAVTAKVRLMQLDKKLWYAVALLPEGADTTAVLQAFDNLTVMQELEDGE